MTTKKRIGTILGWTVLVAALILMYLPILLIIVYSFVDSKNVGMGGEVGFAYLKTSV